jgi:putative ABC transport system substrate-binding protein
MERREFLAGLLLMAMMHRAQAQQAGKTYRIAFVHPINPVGALTETGGFPHYRAFFEELRRLGYVEGKNLVVERYSGEGRTERYAELAGEVVRRKPDLIFTVGREPNFKVATATIPIVAVTIDPVVTGLVSSLAQPGGNITGIAVDAGAELWGKRAEILREAIPQAVRVGVLVSKRSWDDRFGAPLRAIAQQVGISLLVPPLDSPFQEAEYRRVFAAMAQQNVDAVFVTESTELYLQRRLIVQLAEEHRLPAIYAYREYVELGGLMAYAVNLMDLFRHAADQIDQILKGANPGEIPFYQPTTFDLVINLKTAKALGIEMPPSLLARADEVIE